MQLLSYDSLENHLNTAANILKEVYTDFEYKGFFNVKIGRSRTSWGTVYNEHGNYRLTISNVFNEIRDENKAYNKLMSTLIHELIHTIPGCWNHGYKFRLIASLVNRKYPNYFVCRATSMSSYGIRKERKEYSWVIYCNNCSKVYKYRKAPKYRDCIKLCRCCRCNSHNLTCMPINDFKRISNIAI